MLKDPSLNQKVWNIKLISDEHDCVMLNYRTYSFVQASHIITRIGKVEE